jgi:chondroitin AC lyase
MLLAVLWFPSQLKAQDWEELHQRLWDRYFQSADMDVVGQALENIENDGRFADISYSANGRAAYSEHLSRVQQLYYHAYSIQGSENEQFTELSDAAALALGWWLEEDYRDPNWWHTYIGYPEDLSAITSLAGHDLRDAHSSVYQALIAYHYRVYEYLQNSPMGGGANLSDMGYYSAVGAVVDSDAAWLQGLIDKSFELAIGILGRDDVFEGWQVDGSMHAHGPQLHNASYGSELLNSASFAVQLFWDTDWDLGQDKVELLQWQLLEGVRHMTYGNWFDLNALGRGNSRPSSSSYATRFIPYIDRVLEMNPSRPAELLELRERLATNGRSAENYFMDTKSFYRSDFITRIRNNSYSSIRMVSTRTMRNEMGNDEGIKNRFFGDGIHLTKVHGNEYEQATALWNYARLPGLTARQVSNLRPNNVWGERGRANYAGSVTNGNTGLAAMRKDFDALTGWKSWFILEEGVLALGSNIRIGHSSLRENVNTTVNQARFQSTVHYGGAAIADSTASLPANVELAGDSWVWHRDIGYYFFPHNDPIHLTTERVTANWADVGVSEGEVSDYMFTLLVDHGSLPNGKSYAYMTFPGVSVARLKGYSEELPVRILRQDESMHAVEHLASGAIYAAFFEAGRLEVDSARAVEVDRPALLMITPQLGTFSLRVVDPLQQSESVSVELTGWALQGEGLSPVGGSAYSLPVDLPQGDYAGSSAAHSFGILDYPDYVLHEPTPVGSDWYRSQNFGPYQTYSDAWIYHAAGGWMKLRSDNPENLYMMQVSTGDWYWASSNFSGWAFNITHRSWFRW